MSKISLPVRLMVEICPEWKPVPEGNTLRTYRSKSVVAPVCGSSKVTSPLRGGVQVLILKGLGYFL